MQASVFYQSSTEDTIPLLLRTPHQLQQELIALTAQEFNLLNLQKFQAAAGEICLITDSIGVLVKAYVGTGCNNNIELAIAIAACNLPAGNYWPQTSLSVTAVVNWALAQYKFINYKKPAHLHTNKLVVPDRNLTEIITEVEAIFLVRDLINMPTNALGPSQLAVILAALAEQYEANFQQWVGDDLVTDNFPAIYTVGRAAADAPRLLSLTWGNEQHPKVALIGKGVCFDSGGLDLKPFPAMRLMKKDMAGAAHVIGLAQWIMQQQLAIRLIVLIPAVENAIGPGAYRPGDILTMRNGLTVEIENTDAEGRLILADALVKACEDKPNLLIDFTTLTGAARVAVGTEIAAMFTNNDKLAQELQKVSNNIQDPIWRLPLFKEYEELFASSIADLVNVSDSPYAGAITAALFLQYFINKNVPWVHFDSMAWNLRAKPGKPEGGDAIGLRTVMYYLKQNLAILHQISQE